jgi:hypothetical protein
VTITIWSIEAIRPRDRPDPGVRVERWRLAR